jgi:hypothetical protein
MADKEAIKKAILGAAGNPSTGVIAEFAEAMADAVVGLDNPKRAVNYGESVAGAKETRVVDSRETR